MHKSHTVRGERAGAAQRGAQGFQHVAPRVRADRCGTSHRAWSKRTGPSSHTLIYLFVGCREWENAHVLRRQWGAWPRPARGQRSLREARGAAGGDNIHSTALPDRDIQREVRSQPTHARGAAKRCIGLKPLRDSALCRVRDLLAPRAKQQAEVLRIRESPVRGPYLEGIVVKPLTGAARRLACRVAKLF